MKSKYGFTHDVLQNVLPIRFGHWQLLQLSDELALAKAAAPMAGRFSYNEHSFAAPGDGQRLVCLQRGDDFGLIPRKFANADLFHF